MNRPKPSVTYSALAPHRSEPCAVLPAQGAVGVSGVDLVGHRSPFRSVLSSPNEWQISHGAGKKGFYDTEHGGRSFFSLNAKEPPPGQLSYAGMSMISFSGSHTLILSEHGTLILSRLFIQTNFFPIRLLRHCGVGRSVVQREPFSPPPDARSIARL